MATNYKFASPTTSTTFYTKNSTRFYAGGTISANTDNNAMSLSISGLLDATLLGAKIATNTPLMLAISASVAISCEWQGGFDFKYTGIGCEQSTAETDNALAQTESALAKVQNSLATVTSEVTSLANRAVDLKQASISVQT